MHAVARQLSECEPPSDSDTLAAHEKERDRQRANNENKERAPTQAQQNAWEYIDQGC